MAAFEVMSDTIRLLKSWSRRLPVAENRSLDDAELQVGLAERHSTWVLSVRWEAGGLGRAAELGVTNSEVVPESVASYSIVTVRASAFDAQGFVAETLYSKRRAVSRLTGADLQDWLTTAIDRAAGYMQASLTERYDTGV